MIRRQTVAILSADEVGAMLGIGRNSVYAAAQRGELPHRKIGRRVLFPRAWIERWLEGDQGPYDDAPKSASLPNKETTP